MKLLVVGGMHGNEPLGIELVKSLKLDPVRGIDCLIANEDAVQANKRFVQQDMNRSFPGDERAERYETVRPAQVLGIAKDYDVVLDFHNTHCPNNDCGFIGESATPLLAATAEYLGLRRLIVADYDCINKFASNCLSVEISLNSAMMDVLWWRKRLKQLVQRKELEAPNQLERYRFVYRLTNDDKDRLKLEQENMKAFEPITKCLADALGIASPAYPIFIADQYTPYNFGGLLNKIDV